MSRKSGASTPGGRICKRMTCGKRQANSRTTPDVVWITAGMQQKNATKTADGLDR